MSRFTNSVKHSIYEFINKFRSNKLQEKWKHSNLIFGLGSGRSGTSSISNLLDSQSSMTIKHETKPILPWISDSKLLHKKLNQLHKLDGEYIGDVASYYLPYVESILAINPKAKFVCLKREKEKTVHSFMNKTEGLNHWTDKKGSEWRAAYFDKAFPSYNLDDKKTAIAKYWEEYYSQCEKLQIKYPKNLAIYDISILSNIDQQKELFEFLGMENYVTKDVHENRIGT